MIFTTSLPCNKLGRVPTTQSAGALPLLRSEDLATVNTSRDSSSHADARCSTFRRCCSFASGASAMARSGSATIVSLSTADRLPARACVQESLAQCLWSVSTVFRSTGRPAAPLRCLPLRSVSAASTRAKRPARRRGAASRYDRASSVHYLAAALTISMAAPQALGRQSTNARYGDGQVYIGRPQLYTARRWAAIQTLVAVASRQTPRR